MSFWGVTCGLAGSFAGLYVGIVKGAYDAATGNGSFDEGWDEVIQKMGEGGQKFGEEHGTQLTNSAIGLATVITGNEYKKHRGTS